MNSWTEWLNNGAELWWSYVYHASWQAGLLGLVILAVVALGRRWPSPLRYGLLVLAMTKFAVPPLTGLPTGIFTRLGPVVPRLAAVTGERASDDRLVFTPAELPSEEPMAVDPAGNGQTPEARGASFEWSEHTLPVSPKGAAESRSAEVSRSADPAATQISTRRSVANTTGNLAAISESASTVLSVKSYLMLSHVLGGLGLLTWIAIQYVGLLRVTRRTERMAHGPLHQHFVSLCRQMGLRRTPRLLLADGEGCPFSFGAIWATVVLPRELLDRLPEKEIQTALAHELTHFRRGDAWINWTQVILCMAWWFHPVVWLVNRALRAVREDCCDDLVLSLDSVAADTYCDTLLHAASRRVRTVEPVLALSTATRRHPLARRIRRIMDSTLSRPRRLSSGGILLMLLLAALVLPGVGNTGEATETKAAEENGAGEPVADALDDTSQNTDSEESTTGDASDATAVLVSITDNDNRPISGADVWLFSRSLGDAVDLIVHGKSDAQGVYQVEVPVGVLEDPGVSYHTLCAHRDGFNLGLAARKNWGHSRPRQIRLTLQPVSDVDFTVLGPDRKAVSGASLTLHHAKIGGNVGELPEPLERLFSTTTDTTGKATLRGVSGETVYNVRVESSAYGTQIVWPEDGERATSAEPFQLRPVGIVTGGVTTDEGEALAGVKMHLRARSTEKPDEPHHYSATASVVTDGEGRFRVPAIAAGELRVMLELPAEFPYGAFLPKDLLVHSGRTTQADVTLKRAVHVTGLVRDYDSKQPIPGVAVSLSVNRQSRRSLVRTDAQGRYAMFLLPGDGGLRFRPPNPYIPPARMSHPVTVPPNVLEHEHPAVELVRGVTLTATAIDEANKPIEGVRVTATWLDRSTRRQSQSAGVSDPDGRIRLNRVHPTRELTLQAYVNSMRASDPIKARANTDQPVVVNVRPPDLVALSGRLIDEAGKPVAGAKYQVLSRRDAGPNMFAMPVMHEGATDQHGSFRTPEQFARNGTHQVQVVLDDETVAESDWLNPAPAGKTRFPDLVYRPAKARPPTTRKMPLVELRALDGQVVDQNDQPVSDASMTAWYHGRRVRTPVDASGRFHLDDVPATGVFVFVDAPRFRFHGQYLRPKDGDRKLTLTLSTEPAVVPMETLPLAPPPAEVLAKAQQWLEAAMTQEPLEWELKSYKSMTLRLLARVTPLRVLEYLDDPDLADNRESLRLLAAKSLLKEDSEDTLAMVASFPSARSRAYGYQMIADWLPAADRARRLEMLTEAIVHARGVESPAHRAIQLGRIAERFLDLGEHQRASELLREGETIARRLPADDSWAGYARAAFAEELSQIDLPAALELTGHLDREFSHDRHHGNIAHELAAINAADAERVFDMMRTQRNRDRWAPRICDRMGRIDLPRARRIAETIADPHLRAYAVGLMAESLGAPDNADARSLLEEAYGILGKVVDSGASYSDSLTSPPAVAIGLLPVVEHIDSGLVQEYLWKAISLRTDITIGGNPCSALGRRDGRMVLSDPVLAACVARYDHQLARLVLTPPGDESFNGPVGVFPRNFFAAAAILDPIAGVQALEQLPEDTKSMKTAKRRAWRQFITVLTMDTTERWNWLMEKQLFLWIIGRED